MPLIERTSGALNTSRMSAHRDALRCAPSSLPSSPTSSSIPSYRRPSTQTQPRHTTRLPMTMNIRFSGTTAPAMEVTKAPNSTLEMALPPEIRPNSRLASRELKISPAKIQNWKMTR